MERLESKKINNNIYYYYSSWAWKDGKCRRVWQKYLGKPENILRAVQAGGASPLYAEVFQWGLPLALWKESQIANIISNTDFFSPKRKQGLSTGEYLSIAAINRAMSPSSKRSMWEWFSQTILLRLLPHATSNSLTSQRFWDHMDRIDGDKPLDIWKTILRGVVKREEIDLSCVSYDGTNFYTFIDTFNTKCQIAKRGKNKQGRNNLRQINYALFCCADGHLPLYYDIYQGNRNDAKQFPLMLKKFHNLLDDISKETTTPYKSPQVTLVFDKGNNSADNFALLDSQELSYVGSVKLEEHKELAGISNHDKRFSPCNKGELEGAKAFRVKKTVYGKERVLVVTYNQNLFNTQYLTIQNDIAKAMEKLSIKQRHLEDRANGLIKGGNAPTKNLIERQCKKILSRQYMKNIIKVSMLENRAGNPLLDYSIDSDAFTELMDTYLGKNIIITDREDWDNSRIVKAYRSQFIIENVFKEMKDRDTGSWWPLHHWTDSKIKVHALYCTIALLLRALIYRKVRRQGLNLSMKRFMTELDGIREVINIYKPKRGQKKQSRQTVLTKMSPLQQQLIEILKIRMEEKPF
jgi:transposase